MGRPLEPQNAKKISERTGGVCYNSIWSEWFGNKQIVPVLFIFYGFAILLSKNMMMASKNILDSNKSHYLGDFGEPRVQNRQPCYKHSDNSGVVLPIVPNSSFASVNDFFSAIPGTGGWIDVGALPSSKTSELRQRAKDIMGRNLQCGYPRVNVSGTDGAFHHNIPPDKDHILEYCFWENDLVSSRALDDFSFEKSHWEWVGKSFQRLMTSRPEALSSIQPDCCKRLGFLDIGANVGDWISPIRLLAPFTVPIYGVEGSPATAAVGAANFHISSLYSAAKDETSCSKFLPFTLAAKSQIPSIDEAGGVCFSRADIKSNKKNIGGRFIKDDGKGSQCRKADQVAGATTLEHAIETLCPSKAVPRVYILKIDVEGFEFKAMSSVVSSWLVASPPCYFVMEFWNRYSYIALVETLLLVAGYDAVWRPRKKEFPHNTPPWISGLTGKQETIEKIVAECPKDGREMELIFGFTDIDRCIDNLMKLN
mmetsp:Transcript_26934/g.27418  ORF Transcript_26934/g.27418 Transcript_26934/m.27418 type:complete len:481 (-) Transcript_26934:144-1586(-)